MLQLMGCWGCAAGEAAAFQGKWSIPWEPPWQQRGCLPRATVTKPNRIKLSCSHKLRICPWAEILLVVLPCTDQLAQGTFPVRREQVHPLILCFCQFFDRRRFFHQSTLVPFPLHTRYTTTCCWLSINLLPYETTLNSTGLG